MAAFSPFALRNAHHILGTAVIGMWNNIGPAAENRKIKGTDPPDIG